MTTLVRAARTADVRAIRALVEPLVQRRILVAKEAVAYYEALQEFVVVERDGRLVGCGALHVMWEDLAEIRTLAVAPAAGGEGIVLKERRAPYRPGRRSPAWLKVKQRVLLPVRVEAGAPELVRWGDWGWAARLRLAYRHPRTGAVRTVDELVRVPGPDGFELRPGERGEVLCWGVLPSGRLRHPVWVAWVDLPPTR